MADALIVETIVDVKSRNVDKRYDYYVPAYLSDIAKSGIRARVTFGNRKCLAYVVRVRGPEPITEGMKPILEFMDETALLNEEAITLAKWLCYRYACTHLQAISAMIPAAFRDGFATDLQKSQSYLVPALAKDELRDILAKKERKAPKQAQLLNRLLSEGELLLANEGLVPSSSSVRALIQDGIARLEEREVYRSTQYVGIESNQELPKLSSAQEKALDSIVRSLRLVEFQQFVLFGVTGSGKTEVYLRAIDQALQMDGGAIVLVPEIALTPQMVGRFIERFGHHVAILHSGLSQGERRDEWLRILRGEAQIVIGARSAIFAPVQNLRLVIIDEEHEPSYKQEESPRYDTREVAKRRAQNQGATVVLGSATPSLHMMHEVELGNAALLTMPTRVNKRPLPHVELVDMREELKHGNRSIFSLALQSSLERTIAQSEQAILFLNRRGFASFVLCRECGECMKCPNCDISLTVHKSSKNLRLKCHYCQYEMEAPSACPNCQGEGIRPFGIGTQQIEQVLKQMYPDWRIARMDNDTTRRKGAHREIIQAFLRHELDVLIGTQMVAKGLDFPDVSLVGVIAADTMLALPDYRASERTFQLLTQVSGRAGRAKVDGYTIIQTYRPEHFSIQCAARHDYRTFYEQETEIRKAFWYPPFSELAVFLATHTDEILAKGAASRFERELRRSHLGDEISILPAAPSGITRIENKYRYQVVVKYLKWEQVREPIVNAFQVVYEKMAKFHGICSLDIFAGRIG